MAGDLPGEAEKDSRGHPEINGVGNPAYRPDLLDRSILIEFETLTDSLDESALDEQFEQYRPQILGAIFSAISKAIRNVQNVAFQDLPRMADFARWGMALAPALGYSADQFKAEYDKAIETKWRDAVDSSPLAQKILGLLKKGPWEGTPSDLLDELNPMTDGKRQKGLPRAANGLSAALNQIAPALRRCGVEVKRSRSRSRTIFLSYK